MKKVLYDREWAKKAKNFPVYYIWRGVKEKNDLRYDTTVIPPRMLGEEFVKTKGHGHSGHYQEIYRVLEGEAIFLNQKEKQKKIEDIFAVRAKKGEAVIIPSHYSHLTINPSKKNLKIANWLSQKCEQKYEILEKMQGAGYYYTKSGWLKNKNYKKVPKLRFEKPLKEIPTDLNFLKG